MRPDQPFDQERDLKRKRKEKESQIQKVEEAAKRLKNSTSIHVLAFYLNISSLSLSLFFLLFPSLLLPRTEEEETRGRERQAGHFHRETCSTFSEKPSGTSPPFPPPPRTLTLTPSY